MSDAQSSLAAQQNKASALQKDIDSARAESAKALADFAAKQSELSNLQEVKARVDEQFSAQSVLVEELRQQNSAVTAELGDVQAKVCVCASTFIHQISPVIIQLESTLASLSSISKKNEELESLINTLTVEHEAAKQEIESLKAIVASNSEASAAAAIEHDALLKARADLELISTETAALGETHKFALEEAKSRIAELEAVAARADELDKQLAELKAEKEENANRLSELEVEILELKEIAESAQDSESQAAARMKALEEQIASAVAASEQALIEAKKKDEEHERALADLRRQHDEALKAAEAERSELSSKLAELEDSLASATAQHQKALEDAEAAAASHVDNIAEIEKIHAGKVQELQEEMERVRKELAVRIFRQCSLLYFTHYILGSSSAVCTQSCRYQG